MKICTWINKIMVDRLEGELSSKDNKMFDTHLASCTSCQREFAQLKKLYAHLHDERMPELDDGYWEEVRQRVRQQYIPLRPQRSWIRKLVPVAVPVIAACIALVVFIKRSPQTIEMTMTVPVAELLEDEDIAAITLQHMVFDDLIEDFEVIEESLPLDFDETLSEMTSQEKQLFIKMLAQSNGQSI